MAEIFVPEAKYREMDATRSVQSICETGSCRTIFWQNEEWIISGSWSKGPGLPKEIWGYKVIDLAAYKGELTPLTHSPHFAEVDKGNRDRSYNGMLVTTGKAKRPLVIIGQQITFKLLEIGKQLTIF